MTTTLIVLLLAALAVGIVVWATRKKPSPPTAGPREADTAWNDPVTPGEPARPETHPEPPADAFAHAPLPSEDPKP